MSADLSSLKLAVVGHIEWVLFARVQRIPAAGEIAGADEVFEEPAGGGAVAAVQLARLAGEALLITALGEDEYADRSIARLSSLGVTVYAARRPGPTRRAVTMLERSGERAITTLGKRLHPGGEDGHLPWDLLGGMDGVYFTAGDAAALAAARSARTLVATPRAGEVLTDGVALDALVLSASDELERRLARAAASNASLVVRTDGERGGTYTRRDGRSGSWAASDPAAAIVDSYGCGDSFAAGLTYGLAGGLDLDRALQIAARCGAACLTGRGPYERQLQAHELF